MRKLDTGVSRRACHHTYVTSVYRGLYGRRTMCPHATPDVSSLHQIPLNPTTVFYVACMIVQIDVLRENGQQYSEIVNESVIEATPTCISRHLPESLARSG